MLHRDYRDLRGRFDKLVSIEMIEAVGHAHLPRYFEVCAQLLHDHGEALIQAITMPNGAIRSICARATSFDATCFREAACRRSGRCWRLRPGRAAFKPAHLEDIGPHYAQTPAPLEGGLRSPGRRGPGTRLRRPLHPPVEVLYLAYCEAGFEERYLGDVQLLLRKPGCRAAPVLGRIR